jgi:hypothetical protein
MDPSQRKEEETNMKRAPLYVYSLLHSVLCEFCHHQMFVATHVVRVIRLRESRKIIYKMVVI